MQKRIEYEKIINVLGNSTNQLSILTIDLENKKVGWNKC